MICHHEEIIGIVLPVSVLFYQLQFYGLFIIIIVFDYHFYCSYVAAVLWLLKGLLFACI